EFSAAKALLSSYPATALRVLLARALHQPDDYFLLSVLEQTWLCAWHDAGTRGGAMALANELLQRRLAPEGDEAAPSSLLPYAVERVVLALAAQSPTASPKLYATLADALKHAALP